MSETQGHFELASVMRKEKLAIMRLPPDTSPVTRAASPRPFPFRLLVSLVALGLAAIACKKQETQAPVVATSPSAPPAAPGKAAFEPARKTSFAEVTGQLDPGGSVYLYLATDQWLTGLSTNISRFRDLVKSLPDLPASDPQKVDQVFDTLAKGIRGSGLENLTGVGASTVQITRELYRSKLIFHHPKDGSEGLLWNLFGRQAHPLRAMDLLPGNTALAAFGDVDISSAWHVIERGFANSNLPDAARGLREWQQGFESGTKLSWTNLLASLSGEFGAILTLDPAHKMSLPIGPGSVELPEPGLVLLMRVANDTLYDRLSQQMKANPDTVVTEEPGLKMCAMPIPLPLPIMLKLTVASSGDYFFAASSPDLVRAVLEARRGGSSGLTRTAEFKSLMQHLPAEGNHFFYTSKRFSETMRDLQQQVFSSGGAAPPQLALLQQWLPRQEPKLGLAVGGRTPTGWQLVSVGNEDSSGALLLAPAAAAVAVPAAILLPALAKAKSRAQSIQCVNNMKQIGLAFRIWSSDNGDRFPFNVGTSKGGTLELCALGTDGFDQNSFRHFQIMSNELNTPKILVCPADPSRQPAPNFASLQPNNVSYQVRSGTNISEAAPEQILVHCPIHGHDTLCDGSVHQGKPK
jgi:hypothetical protein